MSNAPCRLCGTFAPLRRGLCVECYNRQRREYYQAHKTELNARRRGRRPRERERIQAEQHRSYTKNREKQLAQKRVYYAKKRDQIMAYRAEHKEAISESQRRYRAENVEKIREIERDYIKTHPEKIRAKNHNRRARVQNADGSHSAADIKRQYKAQKGRCYWCGEKVGKRYHVDHVIPLSRGGSNGPENLVIACHSCNESKNNKLPHEWGGNGGKLL